jgi:hypothetical protein
MTDKNQPKKRSVKEISAEYVKRVSGGLGISREDGAIHADSGAIMASGSS